jgi:hypothetical protein
MVESFWRSPPDSSLIRVFSGISQPATSLSINAPFQRWLSEPINDSCCAPVISLMSSSRCGTKPILCLVCTGSRRLSLPNTLELPEVGGENPNNTSSGVVLPAPFLPRMPTTWPEVTSIEMSRKMLFVPMDLLKFAAPTTVFIKDPLAFSAR